MIRSVSGLRRTRGKIVRTYQNIWWGNVCLSAAPQRPGCLIAGSANYRFTCAFVSLSAARHARDRRLEASSCRRLTAQATGPGYPRGVAAEWGRMLPGQGRSGRPGTIRRSRARSYLHTIFAKPPRRVRPRHMIRLWCRSSVLFAVPGAILLPVLFADWYICVVRNSGFHPLHEPKPIHQPFPCLRPRFFVAAGT
ncbi:MAG: hypothetical protein QOD58_3313 [Mycobacterium sp.]|nr:hypothetical protein [Mycobacterium sp.]